MRALRLVTILSLFVAAMIAVAGSPAPQSIHQSELEIRPDQGGTWMASNRARGITASFTDAGIAVMPSAESRQAWSWGLRTALPSHRSMTGNRVLYANESVQESWVNENQGLTHRIEVRSPLFVQDVELRVALPIAGDLRPVLRNGSIEFLKDDQVAIRYGPLVVTDATGRRLEARLSVDNVHQAMELIARTEGAAFPLTFTALATTVQWNVWFHSVAAAGDVNGDGYGDVIVGTPYYSDDQSLEGRAMVFHGSSSGLSTTTPNWQVNGNEDNANFGNSVAGAGDVNGDGYADVIAGCWKCSNGEANEGRAFVYLGSAGGLATSPAWTAESNVAGAQFGFSVAAAGDVNRDGYGDVIVGCPACGTGGTAMIYHGSGSGLASSPNRTLSSSVSGAAFGSAVASADDVNGDHFADVIVGAPHYANGEADEGAAYVHPGSVTGVSATAIFSMESGNANARMGNSVGSAGDTDGDGYADVIIGLPGFTSDTALEGRVYVFYGSATGPTGPPWVAEGDNLGSDFGASVSGAGDVNGDGFGDMIIGAPGFQSGGQAYLHLGSKSGLSTTPFWTSGTGNTNSSLGYAVAGMGDINGDGFADAIVAVPGNGFGIVYAGSGSGYSLTADWYYEGETGGDFGASVAGVGDINGDGFSDVVAGSPANNKIYVFHGSPYLSSLQSPVLSITGSGQFGKSVAGAGDVNGDGYADVIVGAPDHDDGLNSAVGAAFVFLGGASGLSATPAWTTFGVAFHDRYGWSVAGAGDVNGDGYSDVIVGARFADNTLTDEGRAFLYRGSPTGLSTSPWWSVSGGQAGAGLGVSVAGAGDVNGDGYSDVIVGAETYGTGGRAVVYHGAALNMSAAPAWTADGTQSSERFGSSVASAGDVNGDGYDDVIVGAPQYDDDVIPDKGRAFVYHGSSSGLALSAATVLNGLTANGTFGASVAGAGDVNGDGFDDVLAGEPNASTLFYSLEGFAFLYLGSASGVAGTSAWIAEGLFSGAKFGSSVAGAGDINGDGFADGLAGAPGYPPYGRTFQYFGNQSNGRDSRRRQLRAVTGDAPVSPLGLSRNATQFDVVMNDVTPFKQVVRLEVEACPAGTPFGNAGCSVVLGSWVIPYMGESSDTLAITGLNPFQLYHWRARTRYGPIGLGFGLGTAPPKPAHGPWRRLFAETRTADIRTGTTDVPPAPTGVTAQALPPNLNMIGVSWSPVPGATYEIDRKESPVDWHPIATTTESSYSEPSPLPDTVYAYRVRAVRAAGTSANSIPNTAITMSFTNDPLAPGMTVQALHLTQLRTAANKLRACAGIGDATFADSNPLQVTIKVLHMTQLRTAIDEAFTALGIPNSPYTDTSLTNVKVKTVHFQELRDRIK